MNSCVNNIYIYAHILFYEYIYIYIYVKLVYFIYMSIYVYKSTHTNIRTFMYRKHIHVCNYIMYIYTVT